MLLKPHLRVSRLCYLSHLAYVQGEPGKACRLADEAFDFATTDGHSWNLVFSRLFGALVYQMLRMPDKVSEWIQAVTALSKAVNHLPWWAGGMVTEGWARAMQGNPEEGIELIQQGIQGWEGTGARIGMPRWYTMLAEACGQAGRIEEGLKALQMAVRIMNETDDRYYEAETHRMRGVLLLQQNPDSARHEAEGAFLRALHVARNQGAKSFALKAAISLGNSLKDRHHLVDARNLINNVFTGFPEGSSTLDHQDAERLKQELS